MLWVEYLAFCMALSDTISMRFCSFLPRTSTSSLLSDFDTSDLLPEVRILYPKRFTNQFRFSSLSGSGRSCMRYGNTLAFLFLGTLPMHSATVRLASSMNSSMSLLASFDSLKYTLSGLPLSSISKRTSTRSKSTAPDAMRFLRRIWASSFSFRISSLNSPSPVSMMS